MSHEQRQSPMDTAVVELQVALDRCNEFWLRLEEASEKLILPPGKDAADSLGKLMSQLAIEFREKKSDQACYRFVLARSECAVALSYLLNEKRGELDGLLVEIRRALGDAEQEYKAMLKWASAAQERIREISAAAEPERSMS